MEKIKCSNCGNEVSEFGYQKYVKCFIPVSISDDNHIHYGLPEFDEDDYLPAEFGFACRNCKRLIYNCDHQMEDEQEFLDYIALSESDRQKQYDQWEKEQIKICYNSDTEE